MKFFGKKGEQKQIEKIYPDILGDLPRAGSGRMPLSAVRKFTPIETLVSDKELSFNIYNKEGKVYLGAVQCQVKSYQQRGKVHKYMSGGRMLGIDDDRHHFLAAGNRGGKGVSVLIPNLMTWPGGVVIIDCKGDMARETALYRKKMFGQSVKVIDPFCTAGSEIEALRSYYNPLCGVDKDSPEEVISRADLIACSLVQENVAVKDPHWNNSARGFLETVVAFVMADPQVNERIRNLNTVYGYLSEGTLQRYDKDGKEDKQSLRYRMLHSQASGEIATAIRQGAAAFYEKEDRELSSVLSSLRRHIHFLGYPQIKRVLDDRSYDNAVDLNQLPQQPESLYLSLPVMKMDSCAGLLRLFINMALAAFEENKKRIEYQKQEEENYRTLLLLDEFPVLGRMKNLIIAAGQISGLGCKLFTVVQDLSQMKALYPNEWETFLGNCSTLQFFSNSDVTTLSFIEKKLGSTLVHSPSFSSAAAEDVMKKGLTGGSYKFEKHSMLTMAEIEELCARDDDYSRQLVFRAGHPPAIIQRIFYHKHEVFVKLMEDFNNSLEHPQIR